MRSPRLDEDVGKSLAEEPIANGGINILNLRYDSTTSQAFFLLYCSACNMCW